MTGEAFDLLVVGDLNPDLVVTGEDLTPAFGQAEKLVAGATLTVGSSAGIVACGAARLGLRTALVAAVGADEFGRFMLSELERRSVDTSGCVHREGEGTGVSVVLAQGDDRATLTYPGAMAGLAYQDVDQPLLARARHLHVSSLFLLGALRPDLPRLLALAKDRGLTTSLDTNWDPAGQWDAGLEEILPYVDVLLPNEYEALRLAQTTDLAVALARLAEVAGLVVVKRGAAGCLAQDGSRRYEAPALPVEPVDTTGAGDSFAAGLLYAYVHGWDTCDALALASACGSLSARAAGGTAAQATLAEAEEAAATITVRSRPVSQPAPPGTR